MRASMIVVLICLFLLLLPAPPCAAQEHEHPQPPDADMTAAMDRMEPMDHWMTMFHGYAFLTFNRQGGPSGGQQFESENHFMVASMRRLWGGKLSLLGTFTLEPATVPLEGYPLLFQRGETYKGVLLVDKQHPHDLVVQLAARWQRRLGERLDFGVTLAPEGEPAVGPTAYPHRLSASANPMSPLSHHNLDSTHLSADVITLALGASRVTFEASAFHGAEPDDKRWNLDQGTIDSYAGRVTVRPVAGLSLQVSAARRDHPEELEEGSQTRQTASAEYTRATGGGFVAASIMAGRNLLPDGQSEWGSALEATWKMRGKDYLFGRAESVDRDRFELTAKRQRPPGVAPSPTTVQSVTAGYMRDVRLGIFREGAATALGGALTVYRYDAGLEPVYGEFPVSVQVFLKLGFASGGGMDHATMHH